MEKSIVFELKIEIFTILIHYRFCKPSQEEKKYLAQEFD